MLKDIIKAWIGKPKEIDKEFWLNKINREGMSKIEGYNQALQDLTSRIPELEEMIVGEIEKMKESLADLEHKRWAKWQAYLHSILQYEERNFGQNIVAYYLLDAGRYEHWNRQIDTPYESLTEKEKDSDRVEAQNTIDHIINTLSQKEG